MAEEHTRITGDALMICNRPDVCLSPVPPVPYQIVANFINSKNLATSVSATSDFTFTKASYIQGVIGDEGGVGEGVCSGAHAGAGKCWATDWAPKVNAEGKNVVRNDDPTSMNNNNTTGRVNYNKGGGANGGVDKDGKPTEDTNPKKGWFADKYDQAKDALHGAEQWAWDKAEPYVAPVADQFDALDQQYNIVNRLDGGLKVMGGLGETSLGAGLVTAGVPMTATGFMTINPPLMMTGAAATVGGGVAYAHGLDNMATGWQQIYTGQPTQTITEQMLGKPVEDEINNMEGIYKTVTGDVKKGTELTDKYKKLTGEGQTRVSAVAKIAKDEAKKKLKEAVVPSSIKDGIKTGLGDAKFIGDALERSRRQLEGATGLRRLERQVNRGIHGNVNTRANGGARTRG